jgi:hypothetical protein
MRTIIQGKNLRTTYGVDHKQKTIKDDKSDPITVYTGKPEITKETELIGWETIAEFDESVELNQKPVTIHSFSWWGEPPVSGIGSINLSETEEVTITKKILRVDLKAVILRTAKTLTEEILNKEESEDILKVQISAFNKMMIESNEKLLSYCKLHKLDPAETDVDELFKLVYPNSTYDIRDGRLVSNEGVVKISIPIVYMGGGGSCGSGGSGGIFTSPISSSFKGALGVANS